MPEDQILPPRNLYYVLVEGQMNPAIHHAQWYRSIGAVDEPELQAAQKNPTNITGAAGAQVDFGSVNITITCQPGMWWVQTTDVNLWSRIISIAALVFSRLGDTPLQSYSLLTQRHIETEVPEVKAVLANCITGLSLGFPEARSTDSSLQLTTVEDDYEVNTFMQPSRLGEKLLFVHYHCKYLTPKPPVDLGSLINARFPRFEIASKKYFSDAAAAIGERAKKGAA